MVDKQRTKATSYKLAADKEDITPNWVSGIYNPVKNEYTYQKPHVGLVPVNTTSPVTTLQKAYPHMNFSGNKPNAPLKV
ncbi:MAG: hypothetical protein HC906_08600 [Bacteroidales bacterium]|nr:hypothetical protein [Bacteroidales bacterium]